MIAAVTEETDEAFFCLCENDALGTRIAAARLAYGDGTPGLGFWLLPGLALGQTDDVLTLCGAAGEDHREELRLFCETLGVRRVVCSAENAGAIGLRVLAHGPALVRAGEGQTAPCGGFARAEELRLRRLWAFLKACETESFRAPGEDGFYLDLSHRVRHLAADGEVLYRDGLPAACALAGAVTETDALISAVAVLPTCRRQGLGREAVLSLCARLGDRRCHVLRAQNENEAFYRALGFLAHGTWAECVWR